MTENVNPNEFPKNPNKFNSWIKNGMKQDKCDHLNLSLFPNDPNVKENRRVKKKKRKPENKDLNSTEKKSSNVKNGQKLEEYENCNEKKESKVIIRRKKRRRRQEAQHNVIHSIHMMPVFGYYIPKELFQVLKKNVQTYPGISLKGEEWLSFLKFLPEMQDVQETNYLKILENLLYLENYYNDVTMEQYNLRKIRIHPSKYTSGQFVIRVPGLVEDKPSVMRNDLVEVQEINCKMRYKLRVAYVGEDYINVRAPDIFKMLYQETKRYNVNFPSSNWPIRVCHFAINLINAHGLTPLLHPRTRIVSNQLKEDLSWFDENVKSNPEQVQAVQRILGRTAYPAPYLLFGPPGTGKTATIVEAILQIWKSDTANKILVCTPSNAAADEITKRLLRSVPEYLIYRMFSTSIDARDVDKSIHGCSHFDGNEVLLIPPEMMKNKKIIVTTLVTSVRLVRMNLWLNHFSYIFIDEASQATQPETLIPICLIRNNNKVKVGKFQTQIVMSGDSKQLGPVVMTKIGQHLLGKSMLERLMDSFEIYQKGLDGKYDPNFITKLVKNYRSHEKILHIPNQIFYDNELIACGGEEVNRAINWSKLPNKNFPLIFHALHGLEERDKYSPSVCNQNEVDIVMDYVGKLMGEMLGGRKIEQTDIGIVTPFKFQGFIIMKALEKKNWKDISVGTVEIFQGQEKSIIIVSTVRSVLFQHDEKFHIGFLSHEKRFNVTITRAKSLLIVVGNPKVLQIDPCWLEFIQYCKKNEAFRGDNFTLSDLSEGEKKILLTNRLQNKKENKKFLKPKGKSDKIKRTGIAASPTLVNRKLEADSGIYSSFNSILTMEERFDLCLKLEETLDKR